MPTDVLEFHTGFRLDKSAAFFGRLRRVVVAAVSGDGSAHLKPSGNVGPQTSRPASHVVRPQLLLVDLADRRQRQLGDEGHVLRDRDLGDEAAFHVGGDVKPDVVLADLAGVFGMKHDQLWSGSSGRFR